MRAYAGGFLMRWRHWADAGLAIRRVKKTLAPQTREPIGTLNFGILSMVNVRR